MQTIQMQLADDIVTEIDKIVKDPKYDRSNQGEKPYFRTISLKYLFMPIY